MTRPDPLTCAEAFRRLDDFLDRELGPEERARVERHLESCVACAREFRFEAALLEELRAKLSRVRVPEGLVARIRARLDAEGEGPRGAGSDAGVALE